jgi:hypothetical protein
VFPRLAQVTLGTVQLALTALKVAPESIQPDQFDECAITVSVAAPVVALPAVLVKTASYSKPLWEGEAAKE